MSPSTHRDAKILERFGVRFELLDRDEPGPREPWIAIVPGSSGEYDHAIAVFGDSPLARGRLSGYRIRPAA